MASSRSLGTLTLDLVAKIGGFTGPLDQAGRIADKRMREIEKRAKQFGQVFGLAFTAAATAVAAGVKSAIDNADALNDLNVRLGISAERLSGWAYAAKQSGTDIDSLGIGLKKLAKNMADALDPKSAQAGLFKALDIKPLDAATGQLKSLEQILPEISDKFAQLHDDTLEAALAQQLFGKSGADLLEFLNLGSKGLDDMQSKLRDLGGELSQDTLSAADQFNDKLGDLKTATDGLFTTIAADLLPQLDAMVSSMIDATKEGSELRGAVDGLVTVFEYLADVCLRIDDLWRGLVSTAIALYNAVDNLSKLNPSSALGRWLAGGDTWSENWREAGTAADQASEHFKNLGEEGRKAMEAAAKVAGFGKGIRGGGGKGFSFLPHQAGFKDALYGFLNGPPDKPKGGKTGKSDAEREAEQLQQAYDRLNSQMAETIALFGQEGEAVKVRYDLEHGELAKLSETQKAALLDQAKHIDQLHAEADAQKHLDDIEEQRQQTIKRAHEELAQTLDDLKFEIDLLGKSNAERQAEIELRRIGIGLSPAEQAAAKASIEAQVEQLQSLHDQIDAMDDLRGSFQDIFQEVAKGQLSLIDGLKAFADAFVAELIRMAAAQASISLFGEQGTTGGGFFGGFLSKFFGGSSSSSSSSGSDLFSLGLDLVGSFAGGTDNHPGGWSWIGEEGPELMNVPRGAQIVPAAQSARMANGLTQTVNNYYQKETDPRTRSQIEQDQGRATRQALARV